MEKTYSISSKLPNQRDSIFVTIGQLARKHEAIDLPRDFPILKLINIYRNL